MISEYGRPKVTRFTRIYEGEVAKGSRFARIHGCKASEASRSAMVSECKIIQVLCFATHSEYGMQSHAFHKDLWRRCGQRVAFREDSRMQVL